MKLGSFSFNYLKDMNITIHYYLERKCTVFEYCFVSRKSKQTNCSSYPGKIVYLKVFFDFTEPSYFILLSGELLFFFLHSHILRK